MHVTFNCRPSLVYTARLKDRHTIQLLDQKTSLTTHFRCLAPVYATTKVYESITLFNFDQECPDVRRVLCPLCQ